MLLHAVGVQGQQIYCLRYSQAATPDDKLTYCWRAGERGPRAAHGPTAFRVPRTERAYSLCNEHVDNDCSYR